MVKKKKIMVSDKLIKLHCKLDKLSLIYIWKERVR